MEAMLRVTQGTSRHGDEEKNTAPPGNRALVTSSVASHYTKISTHIIGRLGNDNLQHTESSKFVYLLRFIFEMTFSYQYFESDVQICCRN